MKKFDTVDNYYILAFAYRVYNAKWQNIILNLDNDVEEERLSRICFLIYQIIKSKFQILVNNVFTFTPNPSKNPIMKFIKLLIVIPLIYSKKINRI